MQWRCGRCNACKSPSIWFQTTGSSVGDRIQWQEDAHNQRTWPGTLGWLSGDIAEDAPHSTTQQHRSWSRPVAGSVLAQSGTQTTSKRPWLGLHADPAVGLSSPAAILATTAAGVQPTLCCERVYGSNTHQVLPRRRELPCVLLKGACRPPQRPSSKTYPDQACRASYALEPCGH